MNEYEIRDETTEITEIVPGDDSTVYSKQVVRESSDDETQSRDITVRRFIKNWCGHHDYYGYSCSCGNRICRACLKTGRIWYCRECNKTLGPCCFQKRHDGKVLCSEHWQGLDFNHPTFHVLAGVCFLAGLCLALYFLNKLVG